MIFKKSYRLIVAVLVVLTALMAWYRPLQEIANTQVDAGLKRALISFASARTLNGVISVVQGTEFSVQPLGVGVTLTPGQILDPVNDLVEQFSTIMLIASVAFGVQKVMLAIGSHVAISAAVTGIALLWALLYLMKRSPNWLNSLLAVMLMVRFAIPVATVGSDFVFQRFLATDYNTQQLALDGTSQELSKRSSKATQVPSSTPAPTEDKGVLDRLKDQIKAITPVPNIDVQAIKQSVESIPERVMKLIVVFLMQTIIVPFALLWVQYRIVVDLMRPRRRFDLEQDKALA